MLICSIDANKTWKHETISRAIELKHDHRAKWVLIGDGRKKNRFDEVFQNNNLPQKEYPEMRLM